MVRQLPAQARSDPEQLNRVTASVEEPLAAVEVRPQHLRPGARYGTLDHGTRGVLTVSVVVIARALIGLTADGKLQQPRVIQLAVAGDRKLLSQRPQAGQLVLGQAF